MVGIRRVMGALVQVEVRWMAVEPARVTVVVTLAVAGLVLMGIELQAPSLRMSTKPTIEQQAPHRPAVCLHPVLVCTANTWATRHRHTSPLQQEMSTPPLLQLKMSW